MKATAGESRLTGVWPACWMYAYRAQPEVGCMLTDLTFTRFTNEANRLLHSCPACSPQARPKTAFFDYNLATFNIRAPPLTWGACLSRFPTS